MNKMYLVVYSWSEEKTSNIDMVSYKLFSDYKNAKKHFNKIKQEIIDCKFNYGEIEESKDYYCESENGEYLYYHELVYIKELEIEDLGDGKNV